MAESVRPSDSPLAQEMRRQDELRQRMQLQELRAAYLDQKFRDRMAQQMAGSAH